MVASHTINVPALLPDVQPGTSAKFSRNYLVAYIKNRFYRLLLVVIFGLISSVCGFLLTLIIGDFFMIKFQTGSSKGKLLSWVGIHLSSIHSFFVCFFILLILKFMTSFAERYYAACEGERFSKELREAVFLAQVKMPPAYFSNGAFGNYLLRYSNDLKSVQQLMVKGILGGLRQFLFIASGLILIMLIQPVIGWLSAILFLVIAGLMYALSLLQRKYVRESRRRRNNLLAFVTRVFSRFSRNTTGDADAEIRVGKYRRRATLLFEANLNNHRMDSLLNAAGYALQFCMLGCVLGLMNTRSFSTTPSDGLMTVLLLLLMQSGFRGLLKVPSYFNKGLLSLQKMDEVLHSSGKV